MQLYTVGPLDGTPQDLGEALRSLRESLAEPPRLGILYTHIDCAHAELMAAMERALGVPVVGATTGGAGFTERGFTQEGVVAGVLCGDDLSVDIAIARQVSTDERRCLDEALAALELDAAAVVLVLAEGFACDGDEIAHAFKSCGSRVPYFGALAGDDWRLERSLVFASGEVLSDAVVFAALRDPRPPVVDVLHGWCVAPDARELVITSIDGTELAELDYRPASEVYEEELRRVGLLAPDQPIYPQILATHSLATPTLFKERLKMRTALRFGQGGSVILAGRLAAGEVVQVATTSRDLLVDAARTLSAMVEQAQPDGLAGRLVFDCASRYQLLGERYPDQVQAFSSASQTPMLGFASYGELARARGTVEGFHNTTAVMVGL